MADNQLPNAAETTPKPKRRRRRRPKPAAGAPRPTPPETRATQKPAQKKPAPVPSTPQTAGGKTKASQPGSAPKPARPGPEAGIEAAVPRPKKRRRRPRPPAPPSASPAAAPVEPAEEKVLLTWSVHLCKRRKNVAAFVIGIILLTMALSYYVYREWYLPVLLLTICAGSLSAFFFPIKYVLTDRRVKMTNFIAREDKRWEDFWVYHYYHDGVQVAFDQRNLRGRIRGGVMLYYDDRIATKETLTEIVSPRVKSSQEIKKAKEKELEKTGI